jgi:hypothetical protein
MTNPSPNFIASRTWEFWLAFKKHFTTALLGGIFAAKRGYHNTRLNNEKKWPNDYSIRLIADRKGPADKSAGVDLTLSDALMRTLTKRLRDSCMDKQDDRLQYLREFIGTLDSEHVYCRIAEDSDGLGKSRGRDDWSRDSTHLWHIHLSFLREYINSAIAYNAVLSVLKGQTLEQWNGDDEMEQTDVVDLWNEAKDEPWWAGTYLGVTAKARGKSVANLLGYGGMTPFYIKEEVLPVLAQIRAAVTSDSGLDEEDFRRITREELSRERQELLEVLAPALLARFAESLPDVAEDRLQELIAESLRDVLVEGVGNN